MKHFTGSTSITVEELTGSVSMTDDELTGTISTTVTELTGNLTTDFEAVAISDYTFDSDLITFDQTDLTFDIE